MSVCPSKNVSSELSNHTPEVKGGSQINGFEWISAIWILEQTAFTIFVMNITTIF